MSRMRNQTTSIRLAIAALLICVGASQAKAQTQNTISYPGAGNNAYFTNDIITAYGTVNPPFAAFGTMTFGTDAGNGTVNEDPNRLISFIDIVDMGAALGFPNMYIVWNGKQTPNANGWTPSPLIGIPPLPAIRVPDHAIEFAAGTIVIRAPFFVVPPIAPPGPNPPGPIAIRTPKWPFLNS